MTRERTATLLMTMLTAGCASTAAPGSSSTDGIGNAIVIQNESIDPSRGSILSIIQDHVRGMSVDRTAECPRIVLRAGSGRSQVAQALVYVDRQRFSDSCVLETINLESIDRIEIYPSGVTQRAGYTNNSGGLILVFTATGRESL